MKSSFVARALVSIVDIVVLPCLALVAFTVRVVTRRRREPLRVFLGTMCINNWTNLATALRQRGYSTKLVVWRAPPHEIGIVPYDVVLCSRFPRLFRSLVGQYVAQFGLFLWAITRFDVFVMAFRSRVIDRSVLARWFELPLLRLAGKTVILNTYGADIMTPQLNRVAEFGTSVAEGYELDPEYSAIDERAVRRNRRHCESWASAVVSAIDHLDYLERVDLVLHMRCVDVESYPDSSAIHNDVPVVFHAPNHRLLKGTGYLEAAVRHLHDDRIACELRIMERQPFTEVQAALARCDVVADQFLVGAYGRLAIEGMASGKPVLCYLRPELHDAHPIWRDCPIVNASPSTLTEILARIVQAPASEREELGRRGREYVRRYHSLEYVGGEVDGLIRDLRGLGEVPTATSERVGAEP